MTLRRHAILLIVAAGVACTAGIIASQHAVPQSPVPAWSMERIRKTFARPAGLPHPSDNVASPARIELGERLFREPRLSANGRISCATCHNPALGFTDGVPISTAGATGERLRRHTPALWNLAWAPRLYWDGRATSLEDQAQYPMSHADEMASSPAGAAQQLAQDQGYREAFRIAYPESGGIDGDAVLKALAAYERTLVSPPTRFDQWLAGDADALKPEEQRGLALFLGKAQCANCHTGFAFTDYGFHDIGLPTNDLGRGAIVDVAAANHAFKTPGLRELAWTAPYMHDGSLPTLEDVVRHYEGGGVLRSTRSHDMPRPFRLTEEERSDLVAFLESLSSDQPPKPSAEPWVRVVDRPAEPEAVRGTIVSQRDKAFRPGRITVSRGAGITILNDDTRTHNVRIESPSLKFNSGAQEPGERTTLHIDRAGRYEAHCAIHPTMRLIIDAE